MRRLFTGHSSIRPSKTSLSRGWVNKIRRMSEPVQKRPEIKTDASSSRSYRQLFAGRLKMVMRSVDSMKPGNHPNPKTQLGSRSHHTLASLTSSLYWPNHSLKQELPEMTTCRRSLSHGAIVAIICNQSAGGSEQSPDST